MIDLSNPISRQQAITALRALSDEDGYINAPHEAVTDVVRGLPPVRAEHEQTTQPERGDSDKFGVKISETCEDCISRQAAIETLSEYGNGRTVYIGAEEAIRRIEQLPPAQQKPLKYSGDSICVYCKTADCDGCIYEPLEGVMNG